MLYKHNNVNSLIYFWTELGVFSKTGFSKAYNEEMVGATS